MPAARPRRGGARVVQSASPVAGKQDDGKQQNAKLGRLLEELDMEVEARCQAVQAMAEDASMALRSEFSMHLMKLPKKVRSMHLSEFREKFAGDISAVILEQVNGRLAVVDPPVEATPAPGTVARGRGGCTVPATVVRTTRKRKAAAATEEGDDVAPLTTRRSARARGGMETPAPTSRRGASKAGAATPGFAFTPAPGTRGNGYMAPTPGTTSRNPKRGEVFFSKNGSPLGTFIEESPSQIAAQLDSPEAAAAGLSVIATVAKPAGGRGGRTKGGAQQAAAPVITLKTEDGREVQLDATTNLPSELQKVAKGALKGLQSQVSALMSMLGTGKPQV